MVKKLALEKSRGIKKVWYIYTMEYYAAIKNEIMPFRDIENKLMDTKGVGRDKLWVWD